MMKFVVTSTNQIKISAVEEVLRKVFMKSAIKFTVVGTASKSDVSEQPLSLEETKKGALNRIFNCAEPRLSSSADEDSVDYYVSIESGVEREFDSTYAFTFSAVSDKTKNRFGFGLSTKFIVPDEFAEQVFDQNHNTLAEIIPSSKGLTAFVTNDLITRSDLIAESVLSALVPFHLNQSSNLSEVPENCPNEFKAIFSNSEECHIKLNSFEKNSLVWQIKTLDFEPQKIVDQENLSNEDIDPLSLPPKFTAEEYDDLLNNGIESIVNGEVAVVILAGGQGSRLSAPFPKAMMELDIPTNSTLLELQMGRIRNLENKHNGTIPTYIMTSDVTHSAIAAYLIRKSNFGVKKVKLVKQKVLPARYPNGKFVLSADKSKILASPNGNGAVFEVLKETGAIEEMQKFGVKYVDIHPIDNALAKPADPVFVGALIYDDGDAALKVVRKVGNGEKIGSLCKRKKNGKTIVVEYSELPENKNEDFVVGNTGMHLFKIEILAKAADTQLPFHVAVKNEKVTNEKGEIEVAVVHKFERFIFDALELCENVILFEAKREDEFAPVKNAHGTNVDSPDSAKRLLLDLHKRWAIAAGAKIENESAEIEFKTSTTYGGEDLDCLDLDGKVISSNSIL